jgi:hypothetical protein
MQLDSASDTFLCSVNNTILRNNFINNQQNNGLDVSIPDIPSLRVYPAESVPGVGNLWDDGKEGNYWSDYVTRYPNASEVGNNTGIGDTPYFINENNIDHHPLMSPIKIPIEPPSNSPSLEPSEYFPTVPVAAAFIASIAVVAGLVVLYFKRRKH